MIVGLIVHYESTMSSYFPLRYYVNTYNYLNPDEYGAVQIGSGEWAVVCLASGSCQFEQPYI